MVDSDKTLGEIGMFAYLKDTHHARTLGDVGDMLRTRAVDPDRVHSWVEDVAIGESIVRDAVMEGYPEFEEDYYRAVREQAARQNRKHDLLHEMAEHAPVMDQETQRLDALLERGHVEIVQPDTSETEWMKGLVGDTEQNTANFEEQLDLLRRIDNEEEED